MKKKNDAIYGAIAGDVIGSAYEFRGARFEPIQLFKKCCEFTDDSVLTVAVTDWLTQPGSNHVLEKLYNSGIDRHGCFEGHYLQPIATALYQYSYMLRWKGL